MLEFKAVTSIENGAADPDWLPTPEEVRRARLELERKGVVRSLAEGLTGRQLVPAGETPWAWLIAALAWLMLWPGLIALRLVQGWGAAWLPWWTPLAGALIHALALVGPVIFTGRQTGNAALRARFGKVQTVAQMLALEPAEFETWVGMLFTLAGYQVRNTQYVADHGIDLEVSGNGVSHGLVQCKRYRGTVGEPTVRDLFGTIMHEQAEHGWLATTGAISRSAREWATGKPLDLWDGPALVELARNYR
jgi:restriction system protein